MVQQLFFNRSGGCEPSLYDSSPYLHLSRKELTELVKSKIAKIYELDPKRVILGNNQTSILSRILLGLPDNRKFEAAYLSQHEYRGVSLFLDGAGKEERADFVTWGSEDTKSVYVPEGGG